MTIGLIKYKIAKFLVKLKHKRNPPYWKYMDLSDGLTNNAMELQFRIKKAKAKLRLRRNGIKTEGDLQRLAKKYLDKIIEEDPILRKRFQENEKYFDRR